MMRYLALLTMILVGGCAELAALGGAVVGAGGVVIVQDAQALHQSAADYVRAVHDARREIRRECWEILMMEVDKLRALGEYDKARERLAANYPDLVTVGIVKDAMDEGTLSEPFGCN